MVMRDGIKLSKTKMNFPPLTNFSKYTLNIYLTSYSISSNINYSEEAFSNAIELFNVKVLMPAKRRVGVATSASRESHLEELVSNYTALGFN